MASPWKILWEFKSTCYQCVNIQVIQALYESKCLGTMRECNLFHIIRSAFIKADWIRDEIL